VTFLEKRIRWSGVLVSAGFAVLVASLFWKHPLSFMAFLGLGCPLVAAGVLLYLYALSASKSPDEP
jgi:hypothetical protein